LMNTLREQSYFSDDVYDNLMEGKSVYIPTQGGDVFEKDHLKHIIFFFIIRYLPKKIVNWLFKKKIYKFLPIFVSFRFVIFLVNTLTFSYQSQYFRKFDIGRLIYFFKKAVGRSYIGFIDSGRENKSCRLKN